MVELFHDECLHGGVYGFVEQLLIYNGLGYFISRRRECSVQYVEHDEYLTSPIDYIVILLYYCNIVFLAECKSFATFVNRHK